MEDLNKYRHAFVVSPHQDDAVLSLGALLKRYDHVDVANIFTVSNSHILSGMPNDTDLVSAIRHAEDSQIAEKYGFKFIDAGLEDAEVRGVAWNDVWANIDTDITQLILTFIENATKDSNVNLDTDIFIPAAFGLHPDHILSSVAGIHAFRKMGRDAVYLFAEQPYYSEPRFVRTRLHDVLNQSTRISLPFNSDEKQDMLSIYSSQLSPERIQRIGHIGLEYIWRHNTQNNHDGYRYSWRPGIFASVQWTDIAVDLKSKECDNLIISTHEGRDFFRENHRIAKNYIQMIRPIGAGYFDYFDIPVSTDHDQYDHKTVNQIVSDTTPWGDVLWLSGIREDSPLYNLLECRLNERATLIPANSSYLVTCNTNGFNEWTDSKPSKIKSKIRRIRKKQELLKTEHDLTTDIFQADQNTINKFLEMQKRRAISNNKPMDIFYDNKDYVSLLRRLTNAGLLSAVSVRNNQTGHTAGVMLFTDSAEDQTISIVNQAFDPRYAHYCVGFIMQLELIHYAHCHDTIRVDYLRGDESYKLDFTEHQIQTYKYAEALTDVTTKNWEEIVKYVKEYEE